VAKRKSADTGIKVDAQEPIQITRMPIGKLIEYANNPREHDSAIDRMAATIKEFGFKVPIIATSKGEVVDGHLRLKAARVLGLKTVPVIFADDLTAPQIKAFRLSVNESTNWATWDVGKLEVELASLRAINFDLEPLGLDNIQLPEIEELEPARPKANRSKTTLFVSIANAQVEKARKTIVAALDKANIPHNL
jgi:ParB-like chromosome segregation protein Spo0J